MRGAFLTGLVICISAMGYCAFPDASGYWEFNGDPNMPDPNLVLAAEIGNDLVLVGEHAFVDGIDETDGGAMAIGVGSHYRCSHGIAPNGDGTMVNEWTLLVDFSFPQSSVGKYVDFLESGSVADANLISILEDVRKSIVTCDGVYDGSTDPLLALERLANISPQETPALPPPDELGDDEMDVKARSAHLYRVS